MLLDRYADRKKERAVGGKRGGVPLIKVLFFFLIIFLLVKVLFM